MRLESSSGRPIRGVRPTRPVRAAALADRLETWAVASLAPSPPLRQIAAFDERVAELEARLSDVGRHMAEIRERRPQAEAEHREALARWHGAGGKGSRPDSPLPALLHELAALEDDAAALTVLVGEALAEKTRFVEAHRDALARDAARDVQDARSAYEAAIDRVVQAREDLVAARRGEHWFGLFPSASIASEPPASTLVGGMVARLRSAVAGLSVTLGMTELCRLLEADAEFVAEMRTREQDQELRARDRDAASTVASAIWTSSPEGQEQLARERREARKAYKREWGREPF